MARRREGGEGDHLLYVLMDHLGHRAPRLLRLQPRMDKKVIHRRSLAVL